jgi:hydroxymethylbilane synthase
LRPDLRVSPIRGNVETRLRKLDEEHFDAIVLASAGLIRLGLADRITEYLDAVRSVPAAGQGVVGIECKHDDASTRALCAALNNDDAAHCVLAERAFAARLEGSCQSPIAAFATIRNDELHLTGVVATVDGSQVIRDDIRGSRLQHEVLGRQLAERVLANGADRLLAAMRT